MKPFGSTRLLNSTCFPDHRSVSFGWLYVGEISPKWTSRGRLEVACVCLLVVVRSFGNLLVVESVRPETLGFRRANGYCGRHVLPGDDVSRSLQVLILFCVAMTVLTAINRAIFQTSRGHVVTLGVPAVEIVRDKVNSYPHHSSVNANGKSILLMALSVRDSRAEHYDE